MDAHAIIVKSGASTDKFGHHNIESGYNLLRGRYKPVMWVSQALLSFFLNTKRCCPLFVS